MDIFLNIAKKNWIKSLRKKEKFNTVQYLK